VSICVPPVNSNDCYRNAFDPVRTDSQMALPDRARSRAILIGTSTYQDQRLPDLPSVANNLADLKATLTAPGTGAFAAEHCTLIENPTDDRQVLRGLAEIASAADDVLLVYYAGHGVLGARQHELYFGLTTTDLDRPQYSALSLAWVRDELLESRAATKVLILDCCFSGRAIDEFMADEQSLIMGAIGVSGTYTLASSSANVPSLAPPGARYTAFSGELLNLLREGIPAGPAELDLHLIYQQLNRRMAQRGWPTPKQRGTDNAHGLALGHNPGHFTTQFATLLTDAKKLALTDAEQAVNLLKALLARGENSLDAGHPLLVETRLELEKALAALSAARDEERLQAAQIRAQSLIEDSIQRWEKEFSADDTAAQDTVEAPASDDLPVATSTKAADNETGADDTGNVIALGAFLILGIPLWLLGDAARQVVTLASAHSLGLGNYAGLLAWISILGVVSIAGTIGIISGISRTRGRFLALAVVVGPFLLGILFGGHYWWWIDGAAAGIAHLFIFRF
jgi:Caspase domain